MLRSCHALGMKPLLVLVAFGALGALGTAANADPLSVKIKPAKARWKATTPVEVALEVTNSSSTKQTIHVMSCSWEGQWKSSDPDLGWTPWACDKNAPQTVDLAPGAAREWKLPMFAISTAKLGAHKLKLSFTPEGGSPAWSNQVAITVVK